MCVSVYVPSYAFTSQRHALPDVGERVAKTGIVGYGGDGELREAKGFVEVTDRKFDSTWACRDGLGVRG